MNKAATVAVFIVAVLCFGVLAIAIYSPSSNYVGIIGTVTEARVGGGTWHITLRQLNGTLIQASFLVDQMPALEEGSSQAYMQVQLGMKLRISGRIYADGSFNVDNVEVILV
jgi:hypothetical protein